MSGEQGSAKDAKAASERANSGAPKCPICERPRSPQFHPFCSRRCADVDLSRWLSGAYVIPGRPIDEIEGD